MTGKTKISKIILNVILSLFAVILIIAGTIFVHASKIKADTSVPPLEMSLWMDMIEDDVKITTIAIPGSHDSGTYGMPYVAETQDLSFEEQLERGVRYFDIRINNDDGNYLVYHGPVNGVNYSEILEDIKNFLNENPTEFLILDYQHFKNNSQNMTFEMLENTLGREKLITNDEGADDNEFIKSLTLGEARGKCLVVSGADSDKPFVFRRGSDNILSSYYDGDAHSGDANEFIKNTLPEYIRRFKEEGSGIFVLQSQLTDGIGIRGPRFREASLFENINEFIKNLAKNRQSGTINVIMRDFVSSYTSSLTLSLNLDKKIVKDNYITEYENLLSSAGYDYQ